MHRKRLSDVGVPKSIAFCADCGAPISAKSCRCRACNAVAHRQNSRESVTPPADQRRLSGRTWGTTLGAAAEQAIRDADPSVLDVHLAWRFGVLVADVVALRAGAEERRQEAG